MFEFLINCMPGKMAFILKNDKIGIFSQLFIRILH